MRAALYTRISKDAERNGLGVDRQERECRALCERLELDVVACYSDNDISAYRAKARPGFEAVRDAMKAGDFDVLVAWHPDRLTRQTRELEDLIDLLEASDVSVETVTAGKYDLRTPSGRMAARIVGSVAKYESEHKAERQRSKSDELAAHGKPAGGRAPYGYRWEHPERERGKGNLILDAEEAATLRWMADQVLAGRSTVDIQRDLNARKVPTKQGRPWHHSTVRAVLVNPVVAGLRVHRREIAGAGSWDAIFDRVEWEEITATVADPARKRTRPARKYVLAGLVRSESGDPMNGSPDRRLGRETRTYTTRSPAKTPTTIHAERLEQYVVDHVLVALEDWRPGSATEVGAAASEVVRIEDELADLARLRGERVISMAEWLTAREPLTQALAEAKSGAKSEAGRRRRLAPGLGSDIVGAWSGASLEQRRQIIAEIVEHVTVLRSQRGRWATMDERVRIVWRV